MPPWLIDLLITLRGLTIWLFMLTAVFVPLERLFARTPQTILRPHLLADLGYYFLTGMIPTLVLAFPLGAVAAIGRGLIPGDYYSWVARLPIWTQVAAGFAIGELGFYWGHRTMHQVPALWRYHAIHHEPARMDWLINSRAHPIDIIFTRMCGLTLIAIAGLGSPGAGTRSLVPVLVLFAGTFWSFFIHSNIGWRLGWLEYLLSTPHFHHWHHSRDDHVNHNYASILPFYDRIFGTYHMPHRTWPPSYGIAAANRPEVLLAARRGEAASGEIASDREAA